MTTPQKTTELTRLDGQGALVAGGAKNLGKLVAIDLARRGANVFVHYNSDATKAAADDTVAEIRSLGVEAVAHQADLTTAAAVTDLFDTASRDFGRLDIAVNTVGKVLRKPIFETTENDYDGMFAVNSKAAYFFLKEAGAHLERGGKVITVVTSLLAAYTDGYSTYAGGKSPVEHFNRAASKEFADRGISVNAIGPGPMDTPFFYPQETPERVEFHKSQAMGGRLTRIEDIAPIVTFLCTDGSWITGQTLFANGGYTTR